MKDGSLSRALPGDLGLAILITIIAIECSRVLLGVS